jgi:hypothetical protein
LQTALSRNPTFEGGNGAAYKYVCIDLPGTQLLRDAELVGAAHASPQQYACSRPGPTWAPDKGTIESLRQQFDGLLAGGFTPILSWEDWINEAGMFSELRILPRLGLNAKVIVFIRPQIPWINSAWWQGGAWSGLDFEGWLSRAVPMLGWAELIESWQAVPGVESVDVYAATRDVVATFYRAIEAEPPVSGMSNVSLDTAILRFFQRNPKFRSEQAPENDFVLQRCLAAGAKRTPWVVPQAKIAELIDYFHPSNERLLALVSPNERRLIENDPGWWDADAYRDREAVPPGPIEAELADIEDLARRAIEAVVTLDAQVRSLRLGPAPGEPSSGDLAALKSRLEIAEATIHRVEAELISERAKLLPRKLRKTVSINGLRRMIQERRKTPDQLSA